MLQSLTTSSLKGLLYLSASLGLVHLSFGQDSAAQVPELRQSQTEGVETTPTPTDPALVSEQEPWQVCNETSFILDLASAHIPTGKSGAPMTVTGWRSVRPGNCQVVDAEKGTPRYVYARSARLHQGGIREWKGRTPYCIGEDDFTAKTEIACELQNMASVGFLKVVPTERRTVFTEPQDFGRLARTAGVQRLLKDNNYDVKKIDGHGGRHTSKLLKSFLKANKLARNLSEEAQFTALQAQAKKTRDAVGVKFCNKSTATIWTALAYRAKDNYDARGWWPIEKGVCTQVFTENLNGKDMHFYARQEPTKKRNDATDETTDNLLKVTKNNGKNFIRRGGILSSNC